jgi:hypothetical protein
MERQKLSNDANQSITHSDETKQAGRLAWELPRLAGSLDVSISFLRLEIARGKLRPTRLGRRVVISSSEVERYLRERGGEATR